MLFRMQWRKAREDEFGLFPVGRFGDLARRFFRIESVYTTDVEEPENAARSRAFHAEIRTLWQNLPETLDEFYPTPDHLRKRALIKCGYYTMSNVVLKDDREARTVAAIMKPLDEFSVVVVRDNVIAIYRPKSQRNRGVEDERGMSSEERIKSQRDVLAFLRSIVDVKSDDAKRNLDFG